MIEGLKVTDKWAPISGSPIVNVSRVEGAFTAGGTLAGGLGGL